MRKRHCGRRLPTIDRVSRLQRGARYNACLEPRFSSNRRTYLGGIDPPIGSNFSFTGREQVSGSCKTARKVELVNRPLLSSRIDTQTFEESSFLIDRFDVSSRWK